MQTTNITLSEFEIISKGIESAQDVNASKEFFAEVAMPLFISIAGHQSVKCLINHPAFEGQDIIREEQP